MRMPPAATNGIMYETPVISHWRSLVATAPGRRLGADRFGASGRPWAAGAGARHAAGSATATPLAGTGSRRPSWRGGGRPGGGGDGLLEQARRVGDGLLDADVDDAACRRSGRGP